MSLNHFLVRDIQEIEITSNLKNECKSCFSKCTTKGNLVECPLYFEKRRNGIIINNSGTTFLCCVKTKTTTLFREKLEALSYAFHDLKLPLEKITSEVKVKEQKRVNRLVHNLTSINAKNIQEIYDLVPQQTLTSDINTQVEKIIEIVKKNPGETAMMFLRIAKHNIHMKSEFSIYRKLERENSALEKRDHPIHKVLMNVLHSFFVDFSDKNVYVKVGECRSLVSCDYESIQVALYHLIENATKYVKHNSTVLINFNESPDSIDISFEMQSLFIHKDEYEKIYEEGYSGQESKKTFKDGDGIGMWRIKQMLELNNAKIITIPGEEIEKVKGFKFSTNKFIIQFNK